MSARVASQPVPSTTAAPATERSPAPAHQCSCGGSAAGMSGTCERCRHARPASRPVEPAAGASLRARPLAFGRSCACGSGAAGLSGTCERCRHRSSRAPSLVHTVVGSALSGSEANAHRQERRGERERSASRRNHAETVPPLVDLAFSSPGRPLEPGDRAFFERRFGHDFSGVRLPRNGDQ